MNEAQIHAVYDELFGDEFADLPLADKIAALLARYPHAADVADIFVRGDLTPEWRDEIYAKRGVL